MAVGMARVGAAIPPSWRQKSLQYIKGGHIASRKQQNKSLCRAVNPPPFDKGGKCGGAGRGIVRFWKGWGGERDGSDFERVVGMADVWGWQAGGMVIFEG